MSSKKKSETGKEPLKDHIIYKDEDVRVMLVEAEKSKHGLRIADLSEETTRLKLEKKSKMAELGNKIKEKEGALANLGEELRDGVFKKFKVRTVYSFKNNKVTRFRDDNDEELGTRTMNDMDRQLELSLRPKDEKKPRGEHAEAEAVIDDMKAAADGDLNPAEE